MKRLLITLMMGLILIGTVVGCTAKNSEMPDKSAANQNGDAVSQNSSTDSNDGVKAVKYKDGTYDVESAIDHEGYITKATLTIEGGKIAKVDWKIVDTNRDDRVFDETYEEVYPDNALYQEQSRKDYAGSITYGPKLIETQDVGKVDAITGATWTNQKFKEIVKMALEEAKE